MRKSFRVKKEKDFDAIFKEGKSVANRKFVIYRLENQQQHFRVGLSVSKKLGNAVTRNQIKRRIRHVLIENSNQIVDNVDFVVIARKGVETLEYAEIEKNLLHVLKLAKIINNVECFTLCFVFLMYEKDVECGDRKCVLVLESPYVFVNSNPKIASRRSNLI